MAEDHKERRCVSTNEHGAMVEIDCTKTTEILRTHDPSTGDDACTAGISNRKDRDEEDARRSKNDVAEDGREADYREIEHDDRDGRRISRK